MGQRPKDRPETAIEKAAVLIQQRYWEHLTLPALAREVGVSQYRLSRRFHEVMGVTLRAYLLQARLEKAKDLLATTREQITEVALAVGFSDLPRFDKLFKRYTGVTPSAYRDRAGSGRAAADPPWRLPGDRPREGERRSHDPLGGERESLRLTVPERVPGVHGLHVEGPGGERLQHDPALDEDRRLGRVREKALADVEAVDLHSPVRAQIGAEDWARRKGAFQLL